MSTDIFPENIDSYAMTLAANSYDWYRSHAIRTRKAHKATETLMVVFSAAIPVSGLIGGGAVAPSIIGAAVFVLVGLRSTFHWHENYLRYSQAREAVDAERRRFLIGAPPYDDATTRAEVLVSRVTTIEQEEMGTWLRTAATRSSNSQIATRTSPTGDAGI